MRSEASSRRYSAMLAVVNANAPWLSMTPFGLPVVPDV